MEISFRLKSDRQEDRVIQQAMLIGTIREPNKCSQVKAIGVDFTSSSGFRVVVAKSEPDLTAANVPRQVFTVNSLSYNWLSNLNEAISMIPVLDEDQRRELQVQVLMFSGDELLMMKAEIVAFALRYIPQMREVNGSEDLVAAAQKLIQKQDEECLPMVFRDIPIDTTAAPRTSNTRFDEDITTVGTKADLDIPVSM